MNPKEAKTGTWIYESDERFTNYYAQGSQSPVTIKRIRSIRDATLRVSRAYGLTKPVFDVADIGCGAGTQSLLWAELGHKLNAVDVNQPLLELGRQRAVEKGFAIDFGLGSATQLPWNNESMDVCLLLELLEHIADWQVCLDECARVLRPNGILVVTTTNKLCPSQMEFNLPLYSWYPRLLKRYFERLAVTTRPELANYTKYPAVNWFSFYGLRAYLGSRGFTSLDRFDIMNLPTKAAWVRGFVYCFQVLPPLRWLGHVATSGTTIVSVKTGQDKSGGLRL